MTPPHTELPAQPAAAITPAAMRSAIGRFATGVTVITACGDDGRPVGATVSAVTSLSLEPPLVLVCLSHSSRTLAAIQQHGAFAVNVLGAHHESVSNAFARTANDAAWDTTSHAAGVTGSPLLDDAHVTLDCQLQQLTDGGDHKILIGRVVGVLGEGDGEPLLHYSGRYAALAGPTAVERSEQAEQQRAEREAVECRLPTHHGEFRLLAYERDGHDLTTALVYGDPSQHAAPVVYAHDACLLGDVLGSLACDCRSRLEHAQESIIQAGCGVLLYTKRTGTDVFRCEAGPRPDTAVGAGLLQRLGVTRAVFLDPASAATTELRRAAELRVAA